uniref:Aminotransferase-like plant mobile domain-containing protein n=1 Tax=Fagus sylvatica TaxID=28930 RepID=A0A2N9HP20_FAGSY
MAPGSRGVGAVFVHSSDADSGQTGDAIGEPRVPRRSRSHYLSNAPGLADQLVASRKDSAREGGSCAAYFCKVPDSRESELGLVRYGPASRVHRGVFGPFEGSFPIGIPADPDKFLAIREFHVVHGCVLFPMCPGSQINLLRVRKTLCASVATSALHRGEFGFARYDPANGGRRNVPYAKGPSGVQMGIPGLGEGRSGCEKTIRGLKWPRAAFPLHFVVFFPFSLSGPHFAPLHSFAHILLSGTPIDAPSSPTRSTRLRSTISFRLYVPQLAGNPKSNRSHPALKRTNWSNRPGPPGLETKFVPGWESESSGPPRSRIELGTNLGPPSPSNSGLDPALEAETNWERIGLVHPALETENELGTNRPGPPRSRNEICDSGPNRSGPPSPRNGDELGTNRPGPPRSRNEICDSGPNRSGPPSPRNGERIGNESAWSTQMSDRGSGSGGHRRSDRLAKGKALLVRLGLLLDLEVVIGRSAGPSELTRPSPQPSVTSCSPAMLPPLVLVRRARDLDILPMVAFDRGYPVAVEISDTTPSDATSLLIRLLWSVGIVRYPPSWFLSFLTALPCCCLRYPIRLSYLVQNLLLLIRLLWSLPIVPPEVGGQSATISPVLQLQHISSSAAFSGMTGPSFPHPIVGMFRDIDTLREYDWGALTYGFYIRGLRRYSRRESISFLGFWQFTVFWAFEHFPTFAPSRLPLASDPDFPLARRWDTSRIERMTACTLLELRMTVDCLRDADIIFQPYSAALSQRPEVFRAVALSCLRLWIRTTRSWELLLGERTVRQLGDEAVVPVDPSPLMTIEDYIPRAPSDPYIAGVSAYPSLVREGVPYQAWFEQVSLGSLMSLHEIERLEGEMTASPARDTASPARCRSAWIVIRLRWPVCRRRRHSERGEMMQMQMQRDLAQSQRDLGSRARCRGGPSSCCCRAEIRGAAFRPSSSPPRDPVSRDWFFDDPSPP